MLLYLASSSKRRKDLLAQIGLSFKVLVPDVEERLDPKHLETSLKRLAKKKAEDAIARYGVKEGLVLGADTIGILDKKIIVKPEDEQDARDILSALSGRSHQVLTAVCLIDAGTGRCRTCLERTRVTFYPLSNEDLEWYIGTGEWKGKAGAYAVQGQGAVLVKRISGDYCNVVGLPVSLVWRMIQASNNGL